MSLLWLFCKLFVIVDKGFPIAINQHLSCDYYIHYIFLNVAKEEKTNYSYTNILTKFI